METTSHEQARRYIEQLPRALRQNELSAMYHHLEGCAECRSYQVEFSQRENLIKRIVQNSHPRPRFTSEELLHLSQKVHRQVRLRGFFTWLVGGLQTLTWVGLTAAMVLGLVWVLNNVAIPPPEPAATAMFPTRPAVSQYGLTNTAPTQITIPSAPETPHPLPTLEQTPSPTKPLTSRQYRLTLVGHDASVTSVTFSSDGEMLASADANGIVKVWRVRDGALLYTLEAHTKAVTDVTFSPDGQHLVTGGKDGFVKLWLAKSGTFTQNILDDPGWVKSMIYSPNGEMLAVSMNEYRVLIIRLENGFLINSSTAFTRFDVSTTATNNYVLASSETAVWLNGASDLPFGLKLRGQGGKSLDTVLSPDGGLLASGSTDQKIYLWEIYDVSYLLRETGDINGITERQVFGSLMTILEGHTGWVNGVAFSPDGKYLVSGSGDTTIIIWSLEGDPLATLTGHTAGVNDVAISPDGKLIASASDDGTVKLWSLEP
jgi:WD40 repeat protein